MAVWRYLMANNRDGCLQEDFACMGRKISRAAGIALPLSKLRICLDVFAEQRLIQLRCCPRCYSIRITTDGRKVDLDASSIVKALRAAKNS